MSELTNKTGVSAGKLEALRNVAIKNDTLREWSDIAIDWAKQASSYIDELSRRAPAAEQQCQACGGNGMIGGFVNTENGYDSEPCPDCNPAEQHIHSWKFSDENIDRDIAIEAAVFAQTDTEVK